jgi:hypothetical protein
MKLMATLVVAFAIIAVTGTAIAQLAAENGASWEMDIWATHECKSLEPSEHSSLTS